MTIVLAHVFIQGERAVLGLNARIAAASFIVARYRQVLHVMNSHRFRTEVLTRQVLTRSLRRLHSPRVAPNAPNAPDAPDALSVTDAADAHNLFKTHCRSTRGINIDGR
jgi:hypothetical protein